MSLATGARLGPYEILSAIGAGGMGEVYRARDTKLNRDVAIKVLPESFAHDGERLARFTREAQTLASLNHPNIAAIYGIEDCSEPHHSGSGSQHIRALVMELVEGDDLSQRITRGAVPIDEALPIAKQMADALEAAHEQGIIHRDLKPANVKVRADGTVKVLDFGLAKILEVDGAVRAGGTGRAGTENPTQSPTIASPAMMTGAGMILGTAAYMSPEQARGRTLDRRADIWAFGCVLFEMLTGKKAFDGDTVTDILAAIVKTEPSWRSLPADTPPIVRSLLRRCLQKDPAERLRHAGDACLEIREAIAEPESLPATPPRLRGMRRATVIPWALATTLAVALGLLAIQTQWRRAALPARPTTRLELDLPSGVEINAGTAPNVALSPDGSRVVFVGMVGGLRQLYLRRLDQFNSVPLRGTETAQACIFSPDGGMVGFISADRTLKKISLADGLVVTLAHDVDSTTGSSWATDERITFGRAGALWQVAAAGGAPQRLTTLDSGKHEVSHAWPTSIAGGKAILFAVTGDRRNGTHIEALSLAGQRRVLVESGTFPLYAQSGHLLFFRDGVLLATPFDADRLEVTGPPVRVLENVAVDFTGAPLATVSSSGALVYPPSGAQASRLVWVSRQGVEQTIAESPQPYNIPRLARDGRRIVVVVAGDLWIQDTARATFTRLTSQDTVGNSFPVWTPDGKRVVFRTRTGMRWVDADTSGPSQAISGSASLADVPTSVSPDGETLAFIRLTAEMSADVYVLSLHGEPKPYAVVKTPDYDGGAQFSPDGHQMTYQSTESGTSQVYVRPFPGPDRKLQVSTQGGTQPRWNPNGKELFYRNGNKMMAVDVSTKPDLTLSQPRLLFEVRYAFGSAISIANYDVSADGERFVMVKDESGSGRLNVVLNWFDELTRLVPPKR